MPSPSPSGPTRNPSGAALIIILAFVVLLTGLIVAFFSRAMSERQVSNSSANQAKVELFAQGALDSIVGDLKQEIAAGSMSITGTNGPAIFVPVSPATVVPALALTGTTSISGTLFAPNLLKRSAYNQALYTGTNYNINNNTVTASGTTTGTYAAPNRAISASTSGTSQNGRFISLSRWNKPLLLPKLNGTSTTDFTPVTTGSNVFVPPDWILVAHDGSNPIVWNSTNMAASGTITTAVMGRYAYVIYDEGGLLDMNVAGSPTGMTTLSQYGNKGSLALADLTQLTDSSGNPVLKQAQIDAIVGWRNYATIHPPGSFPNFSIGGTAVADAYYNFISGNTKGFLTTGGTAPFNNQTDRMFTSRQQLIQFLNVTGTLGGNTLAATQNALQYLSTFSRDLEQPCFIPDPNLSNPALWADSKTHRSKNIAFPIDTANGSDTYDPAGVNQDLVNPSLLTVHDSNGQPVMKRRFPVGRLALMDQAGQTLRGGGTLSTTQVNQIYDYFGLTWDSVNNRWTYNHGDPTRIYQLSQISASSNPDGTLREPDFFEILKAVINCDSLAKQQGALDDAGTPHGRTGSYIDGQIHNQLIQIGVNLIDQYDTDSYPTCVYFNSREFYGIENLPYMAGWEQMWYRMKALVAGTDYISTSGTWAGGSNTAPASGVYETSVMIQPIIWNPHAPDSNPNPSNVPTEFRVVASGTADIAPATPFHPQAAVAWWTGSGTSMVTSFPATKAYHDTNSMTPTTWSATTASTFPNAVLDGTSSVLTFNAGASAGFADFREPYRLRAPNYPPGSNASNGSGYPAGTLTVGADPTLITADGGNSTAIGFNCGKVWTGPSIDHSDDQKWLSVGSVNRDLKLKLQYKNPAGIWLTYDVIENVYNASGNVSTVDNTDTAPYLRAFRTCLRADPRMDRWGLFHTATFPSINSSDIPNGVTLSGSDNGVDRGYANNNTPHSYYLPQGITWMPNQNSTYLFSGAAVGFATAPGWGGGGYFCLSDLMVNLARAPNSNPNSGTATSGTNPKPPGVKFYYTDADGVLRRSSGWNFSGNDGLPLYTANGNYNSRPVVLNRPFQSVAEMAYASRGEAWKEVDFFTPESGDAALLDAFCLNELDNAPTDVSVAGRVNLNTKQPKVLQALISGASKIEGGTLTSTEATNAAQALVNWTRDITSGTAGVLTKGPLRNRSELVGKFVYQIPFTPALTGLSGSQTPVLDGSKTYSGFSSMLTAQSPGVFSSSTDAAIERRAECVMRALADCGNTRTWNLMIDLVAQVGRYPSNATGPDKFIVEGETRYWVHLAIDRYTGTVVAKLVEPVSE